MAEQQVYRVCGVQIVRGVACSLITARQWFEIRPVDGDEELFEVVVEPAAVRYLPVVCHSPVGGTPAPHA